MRFSDSRYSVKFTAIYPFLLRHSETLSIATLEAVGLELTVHLGFLTQ